MVFRNTVTKYRKITLIRLPSGPIRSIRMRQPPLNLSELSFRALSDLPEAVFWLDQKGRFLEVNAMACQMWGYSREEFLELRVFDINPNMNPERWAAHWAQQQQQVGSFEGVHRRKDGTLFPVDITNNLVELQGVYYSCSIVRDISQRKRSEAALRGALLEIRELKERLEAENNYLQEEIELKENFGEIITRSAAFKKVLKQIEQVADTSATVLICGESGTGKELIARSLHKLSRRADRPMIKINCAALPANLIESELFGHEKGAFTGAIEQKIGKFELADGGTLFLDEIGELPVELQPKLLRALQEGEIERVGGHTPKQVDVRILAATNRDLPREIEAGRFRQDLYYRLNVFPVVSIPLRQRKEDIPLLVQFFCEKLGAKLGRRVSEVPQRVIDQLTAYDFPGNVRELENLIERAIITAADGRLRLGDWFEPVRPRKEPEAFDTLEAVQRNHIIRVLKSTGWRVSGAQGAANILGLPPTTLYSKMDRLGIKRSNEVR